MFQKDVKNIEVLAVLDIKRPYMNGEAKSRPFHALSFRTKGNAVFTVGDKKITLRSKDIILIPKGVDYHIKSEEEELFCVHFLADNIGDEIQTFTPSNSGVYKELLSSMHNRWVQKKPGYMMAVTSYLYRIIAIIQSQEASLNVSDSFIMEYIHENFNKSDLSVKKLSDLLNLSESYFYKEFKRKFGVSPMQYINELRLHYALELINSGYYKISEIAYMSGFNDTKYFSTFIKSKTGTSPAVIKKDGF